MRIYYCLAAVLALLLLLLLNPIPASLAAIPTPTPKPKTILAPRATSQMVLPFIQGPGGSQFLIPKKGVPLTYDDCPSVTTMNATWEYAWKATPPNCAGVENIPMIELPASIDMTLGGNSIWIMGFNEPDLRGVSAHDAAVFWRQVEQKYPTRKLLSPAPSGGTPNIFWLADFYNAYVTLYGNAPRLDGLAAHCYAWETSQCYPQIQQYQTWAEAWGVPEIWVTEFSFATTSPSSPDRSLQQQQEFINFMVNDPKITRYAWFASKMLGNEPWALPDFNTPLINWNTGQPTAYGNIYLPYH